MNRTLSSLQHFCLLLFCAVFVLFALAGVEGIYVFSRLRESAGGWPQCDPLVQQWSGYFDIPGKSGDKHYFYWAFGPRNKNPNAPVLLWMTGGPGCSSMLALLAENGPCLMNETSGEIYNNKYSWNNEAYVIYIDQPAGVGFSTASQQDYDTNEKGVSDDMYDFIQAFFTKHKDLQKNDFFIVGESYGGHYAPATAARIVRGNLANEGLYIRLTGIAVGNGYTNPYVQYASYPELAWDWCNKKLGKPCVSASGHKMMNYLMPACQMTIAKCDSGSSAISTLSCVAARYACNAVSAFYSYTGLNPYDIRKKCTGSMCYNFKAIDAFMNREDVQRALGAEPETWQSCNMGVNLMFAVDMFKNFNYTVPYLLQNKVRVLIYAGDMDFICNWIGNKMWLEELEWPGKTAFNSAPDMQFFVSNGDAGGLVRAASHPMTGANLTFVQLYNAGHMVPMDQPESALFIINKFMQNEKLI